MTSERMLEREAELDSKLVEQRMEEIRSRVPAASMGPKECVLCDRDIHVGRRRLGYEICIGCAEIEESKNKHYGWA